MGYRDDPERNGGAAGWNSGGGWFFGKPVLIALRDICRYHLGTLAMGSFLCAVVTMPRIVLEYLVTQAGEDGNTVTKAIVWALRSFLCCLERCVELVTEYAYVYVAVTGYPFCTSARKSFVFFAEYPVQVALDKMASFVLGLLACVTVPLGMMLLSILVLTPEDRFACCFVILVLAYVTTRLAVGVYDIAVTTLLVCCMHDVKTNGGQAGKYMPEKLAAVINMKKAKSRSNTSDVEMNSRNR